MKGGYSVVGFIFSLFWAGFEASPVGKIGLWTIDAGQIGRGQGEGEGGAMQPFKGTWEMRHETSNEATKKSHF